ncbi:DNA-binding response OmpR family regulator [Paenibacillus cellulosilyticus]|uniref:DNA-binding response OmpR family regulator n=1 Tax=Paenibacillus cellulosilyticus TaxID=375489 RepID=A0A2V2YY90_9BACL|nr:response regulator transcription factor [Paenibacillus cellulosilyticus]PWW06584.1 DNA-binding response OmpR family regulator [Paenibacillus cellulosilyticus]QKS46087.1 response regulator transcription factor [Paenibacillus cellulosilyticus]
MSRNRKILIIEDDLDISRIIKDYIERNGYDVYIANDGKEAWQSIESLNPDFIILDIMLPDIDGIEMCRQIRGNNNVPILILSARGSDTDKVLGLGFGADDYMTKPFSLSELLARVKSNLRRVESMNPTPQLMPPELEDVLRFGNVTVDRKGYKVSKDGKEISVPVKELELLFYLSKHKNQVFSKSQLLDAVWGYTAYGDESTITVYIRRLREKLEDDPSNPTYIKTVWGIGYKFCSDVSEE